MGGEGRHIPTCMSILFLTGYRQSDRERKKTYICTDQGQRNQPPTRRPKRHDPLLVNTVLRLSLVLQERIQFPAVHPAQEVTTVLHRALEDVHLRTEPVVGSNHDPAARQAVGYLRERDQARVSEHEGAAVEGDHFSLLMVLSPGLGCTGQDGMTYRRGIYAGHCSAQEGGICRR